MDHSEGLKFKSSVNKSFSPALATNEKVAKAYSDPPWFYDVRGFFILLGAYRDSLMHQIRFFGGHMGPSHLEAAAGTGTLLYLSLLYRKFKKLPLVHVSAMDYSETMIEGAKAKFKNNPQVEAKQGDAAHLAFPDALFDTVNVANAFHCFTQPEICLQEVKRVLRPGGILRMNVILYATNTGITRRIADAICEWGIHKGILVTRYEAEAAKKLVRGSGLSIMDETIVGNVYYVTAIKEITSSDAAS